MKIAIAQINPIIGDFKHNFAKIKHFADQAITLKCDLVVFSELVGVLSELDFIYSNVIFWLKKENVIWKSK